jgi:hypothetical protein
MAHKSHCISPQKYFPITKSVENSRFNKITFGKGTRTPNENPCKCDTLTI